MSPTLLLVDDHKLLRQGLRRAVEEAGFDVVGEAGDGEEAVRLAVELRPDLVLMDVTMPVLDGIEATRRLRHSAPEARVVILTMHGEEETISQALRAGAVAYLLKDCSTDQVAETLHAVAAGDTDLSADLARTLLAERAVATTLSSREIEVLQLFADGCSTVEAGQRLFISAKTVKNHLASIYEKLDARDRTQAVLTAVKMGIISLR
ncbi:MAG: response regulator transcription factor [Actinomycetota bacterium]|jgi:two-component system, NarL family, response regulator DegU